MTQSLINRGGEVVLYEAPDGGVRLDVRLEQESVWLTQRQMATLFETTPENVLMHLKNVYGEGELAEPSTPKDFLAVRTEGKRRVRRKLKHYNKYGYPPDKQEKATQTVLEQLELLGWEVAAA